AGIFVLLMDALKGYAAVAWLPLLALKIFSPASSAGWEALPVVAGICAVLGHNYTCWLKFKGGKGIATSAGVYLALAPWAVLIALIVFIIFVALTKYMSVGSIPAAIASPAAVWILQPHNLFLGIVTTALGLLAIWNH